MSARGLCIELTHTGLAGGSVPLSDISDGTDTNFRQPGATSVPVNSTVRLVYSSSVALSFEHGAIRALIDQGYLTGKFIWGNEMVVALETSTPLTWYSLALEFDTPPTQVGTTASGTVLSYTLQSVTRYRLVPDPYTTASDAFYESFDGTSLSGLIVSRS